VTLYGKTSVNAWYDITGLTEEHAQNIAGIEVSVSRIKAVLEEEHSLGLPYSRMMLMGFSQGAALSLFCGLQLSKGNPSLTFSTY
jgi:predicted esterase